MVEPPIGKASKHCRVTLIVAVRFSHAADQRRSGRGDRHWESQYRNESRP